MGQKSGHSWILCLESVKAEIEMAVKLVLIWGSGSSLVVGTSFSHYPCGTSYFFLSWQQQIKSFSDFESACLACLCFKGSCDFFGHTWAIHATLPILKSIDKPLKHIHCNTFTGMRFTVLEIWVWSLPASCNSAYHIIRPWKGIWWCRALWIMVKILKFNSNNYSNYHHVATMHSIHLLDTKHYKI